MNQLLREILLLENAAATGSGKDASFSGRYCFAAAGTFGGASVGLDLLGPDGVTWIAVSDAVGAIAFTSAKAIIVELPAGRYRASVAGGAPSGLYASLKRVID